MGLDRDGVGALAGACGVPWASVRECHLTHNQVVGDFTIIDREYPRLPGLLVSEAPAFGESEEFLRLEPSDLTLPSVVAGAFRRYVERVFSQPAIAVAGHRVQAVRAMERLATSPDPEVQNTLVVDVFEHLDLPDKQLDDFLSDLGPAARAFYDRWTALA